METNGLVGHLAKPSVPTHTGHLSVSHIIEDIKLHDSKHSRCTSEVYEDNKYFAFKSPGWSLSWVLRHNMDCDWLQCSSKLRVAHAPFHTTANSLKRGFEAQVGKCAQ
jgi:hypothetical protein